MAESLGVFHFSVPSFFCQRRLLVKIFSVPLLALMTTAAFFGEKLMAEDGPAVIRNRFLEVRVDRTTGRITILAKGKTVLSDGRISSGDLAADTPVAVQSCNYGQQIMVRHRDGHRDNISLPNDNDFPFALVRTILHNAGKESLIINKVPVFHSKVDFGRDADQLKILGTGGLSKPGQANRQLYVACRRRSAKP